MQFAQELGILFKDAVASGDDMFAPSASQPPTQQYDNDNVYQPAMDVEDDLLEGLGDSEDVLFGSRSAGVSNELKGMNPPTNNDYSASSNLSGSGSYGKRKKGEGWNRNMKKKTSASYQIADALSLIATNSGASFDLLKVMTEQELKRSKIPSVAELTKEIRHIEEIKSDRDLLYRCCIMLESDTFREIFALFREDREELVGWLRFTASIPNSFGKRHPP